MEQENRREHGRTRYQGPRAERQQHREELERREVHTDARAHSASITASTGTNDCKVHTDAPAHSTDAGERNPGPSHQVDDSCSERGKSRRRSEIQQVTRTEQRGGARTEEQQATASGAPRGTKRWVGLWSVLLLGIIVALGVITLCPDDGRRISSAVGNIGKNQTASSETTGMNGEAGADGADSTGKEMDGSVSESDESESGADDTTIMIENPMEADAAGSAGASRDAETEGAEAVNGATRLLFAGDVYLSDHVLEAYDAAGGIDGVLSQGYQAEIQAADFFMTNEEFPFSTRGTPAPDKQFTFRVHPEKVKLMQEMGIDLVTLANNHALDYGRDAMLDTIDTLDHAGIRHVGAGKNLAEARKPDVVELNGRTFAFIGATRVYPEANWAAGTDSAGMFSAYDGGAQLAEEVKAAKQQADYVIAYVHWGIEREETPNEVQKSIAHRLVDAGADLVVGAHPHVLQGIECYQGVPIAYSLGNFVFGSSIPSTALLQADVDDEGIRLRLIPGTSAAGYTRKLDDAEKIAAFYAKMSGLSSGVKIDADGYLSAA